MPVYHFTYHTYGSWLPDRPEGFYIHGQGRHAPDPDAAEQYKQRINKPTTDLANAMQAHALQVLIDSQPLQAFELHAAATEPNHLHAIVAWRDDRPPIHVREQIKSSLTRALNKRFGKCQWLSAKAGHVRVMDEEHLYKLVEEYLPKHNGLHWRR